MRFGAGSNVGLAQGMLDCQGLVAFAIGRASLHTMPLWDQRLGFELIA